MEPCAKKLRETVEQKSDQDIQICKHWVKRKKRFCKMEAAKGRFFCAQHNFLPENLTAESCRHLNAERVPCPLDAQHSIYKNRLQKHLKICNARPNPQKLPYIVAGCNAGANDYQKQGQSKDTASGTNAAIIKNATMQKERIKLAEVDEQTIKAIVDKVKTIYTMKIKDSITEMTQHYHEILTPELSNESYGHETRKHLVQTAALLGALEQHQLLKDDTTFIEFGAGKGRVSYWIGRFIESKEHLKSQIVLVDRASHRHKHDNKLGEEEMQRTHRIRVDIADFDMRSLECLRHTNQLVGISKHLCGAATDLTIRCVCQASEKCGGNGEDSSKMPLKTQVLLIAVCCHHQCEWQSFVGKELFQQYDLSQNDFELIIRMAGWAVCGTGRSRELRREIEKRENLRQKEEMVGIGHDEKATSTAADLQSTSKKLRTTVDYISREEREEVGYMCKRLIDYARLSYLQTNGYTAELKYFVKSDVTLENVCILAKMNENS